MSSIVAPTIIPTNGLDAVHMQKIVADPYSTEDGTTGTDPVVPKSQAQEANAELVDYMKQILEDGRQEAQALRSKQRSTYWLLVTLSVLMFLTGLMLISAPVWFELLKAVSDRWKNLNWQATAAAVGIGVADLVALYQLKPLARIQKLMGDMSQMTIACSSFQLQVALRLVETDIKERQTMGEAAQYIWASSEETVQMIDKHFEKWLSNELGLELSKMYTQSSPSMVL